VGDAVTVFLAPGPLIRALFLCRRFVMRMRSAYWKTAFLLIKPKIAALAAGFTTGVDLGGGIRECGSDQEKCDPETMCYRHNECVLKEWLLNSERER